MSDQNIPDADHPPSLTKVLAQVGHEVRQAQAIWPPLNSAHEGYAVLMEEVDELWTEIKVNQKRRDLVKMRAEAVQVAAMAVRFIRNVCDGGRGRI